MNLVKTPSNYSGKTAVTRPDSAQFGQQWVDWKVILWSVAWMRAVKRGWTPILEPTDRSRFPRPILKIGRFSIPIYRT